MPWDDDEVDPEEIVPERVEATGDKPAPIDADHYVARKQRYDGSWGWEQRLVGDGLAVVAPRFMHFDGERVPPPPSLHDAPSATTMRSEFRPTR
jgi:hypothetical protein